MAEDNEIGPVALANAVVTLQRLNRENANLQEGELLPARTADAQQSSFVGPDLSEVILGLFESIDATLLRIEQNFDEMFRQMAVDRLAMLEAKAEAGGDKVKKEQLQQQRSGDDGMDLGFLFTPLGALAAAIGTAVGVLQGQFKAFTTFFKTFFPKTSANIAKAVGDFGKSVSARIATVKTALTDGLKAVGNFFKGIGNSIKAVITENKVLAGLAARVKAFFEPFGKISTLADDFAKGGGPIGDILKRFGNIGSLLKSFAQTVGRVASIVGKLFAPLTIVLTLWDTVKGTFEGWEEGGFIGAIQGALEGFVTSLITKPLDLLKDGVSWIAEKLGFENFAEILDSFSFTEIFQKIADAVFTPFKKIQEFLVDLFSGEVDMDYLKNMFGSIKDFAEEALKNILRAVLPAPDSWAAKFIPDSVYEFANSPPPERKQELQQIPAEEEVQGQRDYLGRQIGSPTVEEQRTATPVGEQRDYLGRQIGSPNEVSQREQEMQTVGEQRNYLGRQIGSPNEVGQREQEMIKEENGMFDTLKGWFSSDDATDVTPAPTSQREQEMQITPIKEENGMFDTLKGWFSSDDATDVTPAPTSQRMETAQNLAQQTMQREEAKASQSQANVNVVNAPTSTTNNVSSQSAFIESPSAVDGLGASYG